MGYFDSFSPLASSLARASILVIVVLVILFGLFLYPIRRFLKRRAETANTI